MSPAATFTRVPPAAVQPPWLLVTGALATRDAGEDDWTGGSACDCTGAVGAAATWAGACSSGCVSDRVWAEATRSLDEKGFEKGLEKRIVSELQADPSPPIRLTRAMRDTVVQRPEHTRLLMTTHPTHANFDGAIKSGFRLSKCCPNAIPERNC